MSLRINAQAPDFTAQTTAGPIHFHEWMGEGWAILFSHPKDFTPVCTTELGYMARLKPEFDKRNCKIIGLSVDPVDQHSRWAKDIEETQGHAVNYPMIGDPDLHVAKLYDMLPAEAGETSDGAFGVHRRARQEDQGHADLSHEFGPQLRRGAAPARLDSTDGTAQCRDAGQLAAGAGCHHPGLDLG
jgi:alkyl hydroperoxide reductase subunit AhpC